MKITGTHLGIFVIVGFFTAHTVMADQLVQKFKNPKNLTNKSKNFIIFNLFLLKYMK